MGRPILELREVRKRFGRTVPADGISFALEPGEFFTMLGPSGSGKSTVLRIIAGLDLELVRLDQFFPILLHLHHGLDPHACRADPILSGRAFLGDIRRRHFRRRGLFLIPVLTRAGAWAAGSHCAE